jgi:hypothetical protein
MKYSLRKIDDIFALTANKAFCKKHSAPFIDNMVITHLENNIIPDHLLVNKKKNISDAINKNRWGSESIINTRGKVLYGY